MELVAAGQGTSVLAGWAVRPAIAAGRLAATRVGREGIPVDWHAAIRLEDEGAGPIASTAEALAAWCRQNGGFG